MLRAGSHYNLGTSRGPDKIGSWAGLGPRAVSCTWLMYAIDVHWLYPKASALRMPSLYIGYIPRLQNYVIHPCTLATSQGFSTTYAINVHWLHPKASALRMPSMYIGYIPRLQHYVCHQCTLATSQGFSTTYAIPVHWLHPKASALRMPSLYIGYMQGITFEKVRRADESLAKNDDFEPRERFVLWGKNIRQGAPL